MWALVCSVLFSRDVAFGLDKREIRSEGEEKCEEGNLFPSTIYLYLQCTTQFMSSHTSRPSWDTSINHVHGSSFLTVWFENIIMIVGDVWWVGVATLMGSIKMPPPPSSLSFLFDFFPYGDLSCSFKASDFFWFTVALILMIAGFGACRRELDWRQWRA